MQKWYYWCLRTKFVAVWVSLIVATGVLADSTTVRFERRPDMDIFENNKGQDQCLSMNASFYKAGWCKCDIEEIFVGNKCFPKSQISGM